MQPKTRVLGALQRPMFFSPAFGDPPSLDVLLFLYLFSYGWPQKSGIFMYFRQRQAYGTFGLFVHPSLPQGFGFAASLGPMRRIPMG